MAQQSVYDLAVQVVLYLVGFQRRVEDGESVNYHDTRAEVLSLLNDLDRQSHSEPGLWENWVKARVPLVYLIDEVMILNCNWPYKQEWANECLEVALLGHPEALGGENFYRECDEALKELETAERHERHDRRAKCEIVMVYYVALQTGFKGRYALDLDAWREYRGHVFSKLPAYAQTRTKELVPEADDHTVVIDPNYEPVMPLLYVGIGALLFLVIYFAGTWAYWDEMVGQLQAWAGSEQMIRTAAAGELPPDAPATAPTTSAPAGG
ncbi:MAG: DotU family type IV/VI secretion system protein [Phycisphaerales bacterium]|nr:DotU family type IV/VI secretion system protein [Phycisphaerales bacterium]